MNDNDKKAILILSKMITDNPFRLSGDEVIAIRYAISSIETDLNGKDIYTKADMIAILKELDLQIDKSAAYNLEVAKVQRLIRDRIDKLKENKE